MTEWFPDATWERVPCGLADHPDCLRYISLAENTAAPWFKLSVFGELILNNGGPSEDSSLQEKIARHYANPLIHFLALPSDWTKYILVLLLCRWRPKPDEKNAELIEKLAHVMSHGAGTYQCAAHARRNEGRRGRLKEGDQRSRWHSQPEVYF